MIVTYPLNGPIYNASDAELYNSTRSSGVYTEGDFRCSASGNAVTVGVGVGWLHSGQFTGKVIALKSPETVEMGLPESILPRIDVVCLRFSKNANSTVVAVKKGIPSSRPEVPARQKDETTYELYLCKVYRKPGAVSIGPEDVTDLRLDPTYCGLMADAVTRIDTEAINEQVKALVQSLEKEIQAVQDKSGLMLSETYKGTRPGSVKDADALGGVAANQFPKKTDLSKVLVVVSWNPVTGELVTKEGI